MNKAFCPLLYKANNRPGIDTALSLFNQFGYKTVEDGSFESYSDRDCIVNNGLNYKVEAEKSNIWVSDDSYSYPNVHIPHRKHKSNAYYYVMTNRDTSACLVIKMDLVKRAKTITKSCRGVPHPEVFFEVPIGLFDWYIKNNNENSQWIPYKVENCYLTYEKLVEL